MSDAVKKVDYNLLHVYLLIYKHKSLSLVAKQLKCTDSAVSKMLGKLREGFNDQLFVRHTSGLEPTAFTEWLAPKIEIKLAGLDAVIEEAIESAFEPERDVVISLLSIDIGLFGSVLYSQLSQSFPNVKFNLVSWSENITDKIATKKVDFAVGPTLNYNSKLCYQSIIFETHGNIVIPNSETITSWDDLKRYSFLKPLIPGWNSINTPVLEKVLQNKVPSMKGDLTDVNDIFYANDIMLNQAQSAPCGIGLFSYQVDRFKQSVNSEVHIINPNTYGEYSHVIFECSLYEYVGNRGNHFYEQVKAILIDTLSPKE